MRRGERGSRLGGILLVLCIFGPSVQAADRPNVLIVLADDCTYSDLPLYGGRNAKTPHIDRLARAGLVFERAYVGSAMCQPCRSELYTGLYPMRNGSAWNHSASRRDVRSLPHYLGELGYRVGLAGKTHIEPPEAFPFERVPGFDDNCVREPTLAHDLKGVREFMTRKRDEPFCLVVALVEPHVPWSMGDPSKYPPDEIELPPNIADTPETRRSFAAYLAEIAYMDGQVGEILATLDESKQAETTLVLFSSEQGAQFPGCKWTNWDSGLHTALVARWPSRIEPGTRTRALVQYADVLPTIIEACGGDPSKHAFDGTSFLGVLEGRSDAHRRFVYGVHNNVPEGPPYPIRSVSDGTWRYIRNLLPEEIYIEKHLMGTEAKNKPHGSYWASWVRDAWKDARTHRLVKRYLSRPREELYHTAKDPFEFESLVNETAHADILAKLRGELDRWLGEQGDPGAPQDTFEALEASRRGEHLYPKARPSD
ncbi:MAG TPA: sulfatase [Planctomycetota bacterium]|nr:sulfatase [Planctomycetota bacterium]